MPHIIAIGACVTVYTAVSTAPVDIHTVFCRQYTFSVYKMHIIPLPSGADACKLCVVQLCVSTVFTKQFFMIACFDYFAFIDNYYLIGVTDSGKSVSDNKAGLALSLSWPEASWTRQHQHFLLL